MFGQTFFCCLEHDVAREQYQKSLCELFDRSLVTESQVAVPAAYSIVLVPCRLTLCSYVA